LLNDWYRSGGDVAALTVVVTNRMTIQANLAIIVLCMMSFFTAQRYTLFSFRKPCGPRFLVK